MRRGGASGGARTAFGASLTSNFGAASRDEEEGTAKKYSADATSELPLQCVTHVALIDPLLDSGQSPHASSPDIVIACAIAPPLSVGQSA